MHYCDFFLPATPPPPISTLFPYTTLFRSCSPSLSSSAPCAGFRKCCRPPVFTAFLRSEEHTSELQSRGHLVCRLLLEKKKGAQGLFSSLQCVWAKCWGDDL